MNSLDILIMASISYGALHASEVRTSGKYTDNSINYYGRCGKNGSHNLWVQIKVNFTKYTIHWLKMMLQLTQLFTLKLGQTPGLTRPGQNR